MKGSKPSELFNNTSKKNNKIVGEGSEYYILWNKNQSIQYIKKQKKERRKEKRIKVKIKSFYTFHAYVLF